jgi:hypothetical protein
LLNLHSLFFQKTTTYMFKKLQSLFYILFIFLQLNGQTPSTSNYAFTTGTTGNLTLGNAGQAIDMASGTTTLVGPGKTNNFGLSIVNDMDFFIMGTRTNFITVATNGSIGLGNFTSATANIAGATALRVGALVTGTGGNDMATHSTGKIHYKITGTAPNRVLVVEYLNMSIPRSSDNADATFQVRLYETTGVIEFVYANMSVNGTISTTNRIGFSSNTTANNYATVNSSSNTVTTSTITNNTYTTGTIPNLHSPIEGSRRFYRFTPPVVNVAGTIGVNSPLSGAHNLSATAASPTSGIVNYAIYRQTGGVGNYQFFSTTNASMMPLNTKATGLTANTLYNYQLYAISEGYVGPVSNTATITTTAPINITSIADGNWNNPAIWSPMQVPTFADNVVVNNTIQIDLNNGTANCKTLNISSTGILGFDDISTNGSIAVNGDVIVNGIFVARNSTVGGRTLSLSGNLTVGGSVDFIELGSTLNFFGSGNFSITTTGTGFIVGTDALAVIPNTGVIRNLRLNNLGNVSINNTKIIVSEVLSLGTGTLITNDNIVLDNTQTIGGVTNPAAVTLFRGTNSAEIVGILNIGTNAIYNVSYATNVNSTPNTNIIAGNELNNAVVNAQGLNNLSIANFNGITYIGGNLLVKNTLSLGGNLNLGNNNITVGTSTLNRGSILQSSNSLIMTTGTVTRWLNTTNISAGNILGILPIGVNNENRSFWISGQPTTGGTISVRYVDGTGATPLTNPFIENSINYNVRTNANWIVSTGNGLAGSAFSLRLRAANIVGVTNVSQVNLSLAPGIAPGIYSAGTFANAEPEGNRITLSAADLNNTYYLAGNDAINPLPLRLLTFDGLPNNKDAILNWATCCEEDISKFIVERFAPQSNSWINIGSTLAKGNSIRNDYTLTDFNLYNGIWLYRLKIMEKDGTFNYSPIVSVKINNKVDFELKQNYPNPSTNGLTNIAYQIGTAAEVNLQVIGIDGKLIESISSGNRKSGYYNIILNTKNYAPGNYIIQLSVIEKTTNKKIVLQKKMLVQ